MCVGGDAATIFVVIHSATRHRDCALSVSLYWQQGTILVDEWSRNRWAGERIVFHRMILSHCKAHRDILSGVISEA